MKRSLQLVWNWEFWKDEQGQDLIEYALMAGFVAVVAAATMPTLSKSIADAFSKINSALSAAGTPPATS